MTSLSQHKPLFLQSLLTVCSLTQMKSDVIVYSRKDKITVKSFMNHLIFLLLCPPPQSTQQWYEYEASELLPLQSELEPFITILLPHCRGQETQRPTEREGGTAECEPGQAAITVHESRMVHRADRAFVVVAPKMWNDLLLHIRNSLFLKPILKHIVLLWLSILHESY